MREQFLPFALPDLDETEYAEIREALASGWVTTGPKTRLFESQFAAAVGAKHAIAVNSCTAAMHLALEAIGLGRGDEVITTPYTFAATAEVIRYFDARPVLVDVERRYLNIDPALVEAAVTPRTKAIMPVHIAGVAADLDPLHAIAARHGLRVIEDAAHAFPTTCGGRMVGGLSDCTCFSFYATKTITTGEGGMITTGDDALAERCRIMALHGISKDAWKRYTAEGSWYYEIIAPGFKYNMTDVAAAMGIAQLRKYRAMHERRSAIARAYTEAFSRVPELQAPSERPGERHAWHLYMLRLNLDRLRIDRAAFVEELKKKNIGTSVHFIPLHVHPYYRETFGYTPADLPVAYGEYLREISLPIFSKMSDGDVRSVIGAVTEIAGANRR
ncbi:MAG TPA: DegT/DnrJ/EryC1/StrS family aminotransferase [Bacteroidota bacterium]|nr:DegT/DnrJ/EryC1/StrS family aminotransferase [Bacteroidota bacterium]